MNFDIGSAISNADCRYFGTNLAWQALHGN